MNKDKLQGFLYGVVIVTLLLVLSGSALAESTSRQLMAIYSDIKVYVDGALITPKDAKGQTTEPFVVDGSVYLPVRAVAEAVGRAVEWDSAAQSVYVGTKPVTGKLPDSSKAKIAIITMALDQNVEEYFFAEEMVKKYGANRIMHLVWPERFMEEQEKMISIAASIAADTDVKALIINQAVQGTCAALDKILETRDDIFIICCSPQEAQWDVVARADLIIMEDYLAMGPAMAQQAHKMGAETFVHYSFPRHMTQSLISGRRDLILEECNKLGMTFVQVTAPDPMGDAGMDGAQKFILEDVPKMVEKYGKDTAFFSTNCGMQEPLIKSVVETGAIYPQPCDPSPYHGFPAALGIATPEDSIADREYVIAETTRILKEKGALGRLSTWPVSVAMLFTNVGVDYSFKVINGEVRKDKPDMAVLQKLLKDYAGVTVYVNHLEYDDYDAHVGGYISGSYDNWILIREDYLTYGK